MPQANEKQMEDRRRAAAGISWIEDEVDRLRNIAIDLRNFLNGPIDGDLPSHLDVWLEGED